MKKERSRREIQIENMKQVIQLLNNGEMTRERFDEIKDLALAPGWTVGELMKASIDMGSLKWTKDKSLLIFPNYSNIDLDPDAEVAEKIRKKVQETGQQPATLIAELIREYF